MRLIEIHLALIFLFAIFFAVTVLNISMMSEQYCLTILSWAYVQLDSTKKFQFVNISSTINSILLSMCLNFNTLSNSLSKLNETATDIICLSAFFLWWEASRSYHSLHSYNTTMILFTEIDYQVFTSTYKYCDDVSHVNSTEVIIVSFIVTLSLI